LLLENKNQDHVILNHLIGSEDSFRPDPVFLYKAVEL
jgi:hypothetical protein